MEFAQNNHVSDYIRALQLERHVGHEAVSVAASILLLDDGKYTSGPSAGAAPL